MTAPRFELTSQRQKASRLPTTEPPGRATLLLYVFSPLTGMFRRFKCNLFWGGRGCDKFVPVLRGDGTKIAPPGDLFDQLPGEMI